MKTLGQIAYEAAAKTTDCKQPWDQANQLKWEDAARAVHGASWQLGYTSGYNDGFQDGARTERNSGEIPLPPA